MGGIMPQTKDDDATLDKGLVYLNAHNRSQQIVISRARVSGRWSVTSENEMGDEETKIGSQIVATSSIHSGSITVCHRHPFLHAEGAVVERESHPILPARPEQSDSHGPAPSSAQQDGDMVRDSLQSDDASSTAIYLR